MRYLLLVLPLLLAGCPQDPVHPNPPPPPDPNEVNSCDDAGKKIAAMNCPQATSPDGRSWGDVCKDRMKDGISLHPNCIATNPKVKTCADIDPVCNWGTK